MSKLDNKLFLNGVIQLHENAAVALSKHSGGVLSLDGITNLAPNVAAALANHKGGVLSLNGLADLSVEAAVKLARYSGDLTLDGLTTLSDAAAVALASHKGELSLNGITKISDGAFDALAKHGGAVDIPISKKRAKSSKAKSIGSTEALDLKISYYVSFCLVCRDVSESCSWFSSDQFEAFAKPDWELSLFFDASRQLVGARLENSKEMILGQKQIHEEQQRIFHDELSVFGMKQKYQAAAMPDDSMSGSVVSWIGDARDLPDDDSDAFKSAIAVTGALVVWKQVRTVDWQIKNEKNLEDLIDQGDVDDYCDSVGVFL